ncbi:hypothetical protein [Erwinia sp. HR93]|uniref:hypothetical protein n=1 Tax=Erwinia sp. HR93 TaxID=3094840 RepID=UPI002ADEB0CD|nr:hypothetical protein [Erwinia sp. HR93]MEA1063273.1 hypothetical protein [Erwinia sp. HR93]
MMPKIYKIVGVGLLLILLLALYAWIQQQRRQDNFSCIANVIQHNKETTINLIMSYVFGKDIGYLGVDGNIEQRGEISHTISRRIFFSYYNEDDNYFMHSTKNIIFPNDDTKDVPLDNYLPQFYLEGGKDIFMKIVYQRSGQYFFYADPVTTFACKRIER